MFVPKGQTQLRVQLCQPCPAISVLQIKEVSLDSLMLDYQNRTDIFREHFLWFELISLFSRTSGNNLNEWDRVFMLRQKQWLSQDIIVTIQLFWLRIWDTLPSTRNLPWRIRLQPPCLFWRWGPVPSPVPVILPTDKEEVCLTYLVLWLPLRGTTERSTPQLLSPAIQADQGVGCRGFSPSFSLQYRGWYYISLWTSGSLPKRWALWSAPRSIRSLHWPFILIRTTS